MGRRPSAPLAILLVLAVVGSAPLQAREFYEGKTVRIVVGFAAGGGFDTYARIIARHVAKHIPGRPAVIVENMTGAGSLIAANHLYNVAKPDGLTMAHFTGGLLLGQILSQPGIEFDARRFEFVGAAVKEDIVCALTKASGITTVEQWMAAKTPVKLGGNAPGVTPDNAGRILKAALGLPIQVVSGYKGTADIRLAADSGELAGGCWSWESMRTTWRSALSAGTVVAVLQLTARGFPDLAGVPLAISLAKTDEAIQVVGAASRMGYAWVSIGHHLLSHPTVWPQPLPMLARLAPETGRMRLKTSMLLLPLVSPVDAAENIATLDHITHGRLDVGVSVVYREPELETVGPG